MKGEGPDTRDVLARAADLDIDGINPEVAGMVKELLDLYKDANLARISDEIAQIYEWSSGIIEKLKARGRVMTQPAAPTDPE